MTFTVILAAAMIAFSLLSIADGLSKVAQAIEARRAATGNTDAVHESAVPNGNAP